jgi:hypothetical protein
MATPRRRRAAINKQVDDDGEASSVGETTTMLVDNYPDLDSELEVPVEDDRREIFAEKARKLFRERMREG